MTTLYRADPVLCRVVPVTCLKGEWPYLDADRRPIKPETHFGDQEEAWRELRRMVRYQWEHAQAGVRGAELVLCQAGEMLVRAEMRAAAVEENYCREHPEG